MKTRHRSRSAERKPDARPSQLPYLARGGRVPVAVGSGSAASRGRATASLLLIFDAALLFGLVHYGLGV